MLETTLKEIVSRFNDFVMLPKEVINGVKQEILVLADIAKHEKQQETDDLMQNKLVLTLYCIEEENSLKNNYPVMQIDNVVSFQKPILYLNLYLLFSSNYKLYNESLKHISLVLQFFQANTKISYTDEFNNTYDLTFTIHNIGFENYFNIWTVLGGHAMPSVLYKARLLFVQQSPPSGGSVILEANSNEQIK